MGSLTNRIILEDDTTLSDLSLALTDANTQTASIVLVSAEDAIYLGSELPFNTRYFRVTTANTNAAVVGVKYWDGTAFVDAVDVLDGTSVAGKPFAQDGWISWKADKDSGDPVKMDTDDMPVAELLNSLKIYDLYWFKLTVSADLSAGTALGYVGYKFAEDSDVSALRPALGGSDIKGQFETGKTDWDVQLIHASDMIIRDIKNDNRFRTMVSANQLLDPTQLTHAAVYQLERIVYPEFGDDFKDELALAEKNYAAAIDDVLKIDIDGNTRLNDYEYIPNATFKRR